LRSGRWGGDGEFSKRCHAFIESRFGARRALLTTSCSTALEMAALLLKRGEGDEVIVPGFGFATTAGAFVLHGYRPVFAEIKADTMNLDETKLDALITDKTRAIVPLHYGGVACEMDAIMALAHRRGVAVVEDAAQGVGATYRGRALGTIGDLGAYSFHETKNLGCGEGGALLVNRADLEARAVILRDKGTNRAEFFRGLVDKYTWVDVGSSYLPADVLAAILLAQLEALDAIQAKRRALWERYDAALRPLVATPRIPEGVISNHHIYCIVVESLDQRTKLIAHLDTRGISAHFHYVPLHLSPMGRRFSSTVLPVVESIADRLLRLPLHLEMEVGDVDRVVEAIAEYYHPR
jgi:dTDP-4-amino-4,6-dideoxygalactose transaminase